MIVIIIIIILRKKIVQTFRHVHIYSLQSIKLNCVVLLMHSISSIENLLLRDLDSKSSKNEKRVCG